MRRRSSAARVNWREFRLNAFPPAEKAVRSSSTQDLLLAELSLRGLTRANEPNGVSAAALSSIRISTGVVPLLEQSTPQS